MIRKVTHFGLYTLIVFLILWIISFIWFIEQTPRTVEDDSTPTDAIVVLTGGSSRVLTGITLLAEDKAKKLLISGVGENANIEQLKKLSAEVIPAQIGPIEKRVTLGHLAENTQGNATETAIWMAMEDFHSLRLVTSNYHIPRSMLQFQAAMPNIKIIPHPVFAHRFKLKEWWRFPGTAKLIISEYVKFVAFKLVIALNAKLLH